MFIFKGTELFKMYICPKKNVNLCKKIQNKIKTVGY